MAFLKLSLLDREDRNMSPFWGILFPETCTGPRFHARGRLQPIEMDGLPVLHVVDAVGAVLLAMCRFHGRIARHASAVRRRPPADL